ncbi:MAG: DUF2851 family protein [Flavobacteriales bacterium]|nr:DUF2851 family protein [Flavobacteriales bacterium]MBP9079587.1 DUF2851 family protein [Flavobacteriales bacterium]
MEARHASFEVAETGPLATDLLLDPAFPYGEDLLQFIWEAGLYDGTDLRTTNDEQLEVLHAGRIQPNGGPDLSGAQVRIGAQLWAGNVEVHLRTSDWNAHGHQHDPAYNNVVLHTVYQHDAEVRTENGTCPPTVELRGRIHQRNLQLHQALMTAHRTVPCATHLGRVEPVRIRLWLERLLVERLERKALEVETLYRSLGNDPQETLHHLLLRGLGKPVNSEPFGMLAHALPLKLLLKYREDGLRVEALLLGQAGFLDEVFSEEHPLRLQQEYRWLAGLHGLRPVPVAAWKLGRLRPPNFPTVRLAQWAAVLSASGHGGYDQLLVHDDHRPIGALLEVEPSGYWRDHYRPGHASLTKAKPMGQDMARNLVINAIVPYLFAMGRIRGHQPWEDRALALLEQLPAERNAIIREWGALGVAATSAGQGQALIELRNRYCMERKCLSCAIGIHLHKG